MGLCRSRRAHRPWNPPACTGRAAASAAAAAAAAAAVAAAMAGLGGNHAGAGAAAGSAGRELRAVRAAEGRMGAWCSPIWASYRRKKLLPFPSPVGGWRPPRPERRARS